MRIKHPILWIAPVLVVGSGLAYWMYKTNQSKSQLNDLQQKLQDVINKGAQPGATQAQINAGQIAANQQASTSVAPASGCGYPLKKGSDNNCVKQLQQALVNAYGADVLPHYGVDGDWGSETESAMMSKTGKDVISSPGDLTDTIMQIIAAGAGLQYVDGSIMTPSEPDPYGTINWGGY